MAVVFQNQCVWRGSVSYHRFQGSLYISQSIMYTDEDLSDCLMNLQESAWRDGDNLQESAIADKGAGFAKPCMPSSHRGI